MKQINHDMVLILDFGSQFTQLIARRVREAHVYCEIVPFNADLSVYPKDKVKGYILSGGPSSLHDDDAPRLLPAFYDTDKPILGICYGMQLLADQFGGRLVRSEHREYGRAHLTISDGSQLFSGLPNKSQVWMSHGDSIVDLPKGFSVVGETESLAVAAIVDTERRRFGVQFHPEVHHTEEGRAILHNFLYDICGVKPDWTPQTFADEAIEKIHATVGNGKVILGISGGVDSTVTAVLLWKALGDRVHPIFVDNGVLRKNEFQDVLTLLSGLNIPVHGVDAADRFLTKLKGITEPEQKRKIIGNTFIDVFEEEAVRIGGAEFLGQGTLYPDVIESVSFKGPSVTIKTHHNVGGLKDRMKLKLVEPLRELFKDEVRELGKILGLPEQYLQRHPFPGPGLAVRILGEVTKERCDLLREVDALFIGELYKQGLYSSVWQAFAVLLPIKSVGVMGDERTYENVVALRAVASVDGMTADWVRFDHDFLAHVSNRIIREIRGVNRVTYDISSKPPATIEWE